MSVADSSSDPPANFEVAHSEFAGLAAGPGEQPYANVEVVARVSTLRDSALEAIRDSILTGRLATGSRLIEATLARDLGISRGPLREALAVLQNDGLVEVIPQRGGGRFVRTFTEREVDEFYSLRAVVESYAVKLVIESLTEEKEQLLEEAACRVHAAEQRRLSTEIIVADLAFHELFYSLSGHRLLQEVWADDMLNKLRLLIHLTLPDERKSPSNSSSHQRIVREIRSGNVRHAQQLVSAHIEASRKRARQAVVNQAGLGPASQAGDHLRRLPE